MVGGKYIEGWQMAEESRRCTCRFGDGLIDQRIWPNLMSGLVGRRIERWVGGQINQWVDKLASGLVDGSTRYP